MYGIKQKPNNCNTTDMRKKIVAGNWKMNTNLSTGRQLASEIIPMVNDEVIGDAEVILCPPFVHLTPVIGLVQGTRIKVGAQNCHQEKSGAFTGEVSAPMLSSIGADYVIIGHSERRQYFNEDNALLAQKGRCSAGGKHAPYILLWRNPGRT